MRKPEAAFANNLCSHLRDAGWFVQRIESGETGSGIPDVSMIKAGVDIWMELKAMPNNTWPMDAPIPFRPAQWPWLHTNDKHGGKSVIGIKVSNGYVFLTVRDAVAGDDHKHYVRNGGRSVMYLPRLDVAKIDSWLLAI